MASYFIPSFLSGWELPNFSANAISAGLQKRILSFLLRRSLGHLVQGGQLDLDQIDAGIGSGKLEIKDLHLDSQAVNGLIRDLPVELAEGVVGRIAIQLPWPNLWSGELSFSVSDIDLRLNLRKIQPSEEPFSTPSLDPHDLSASLASVTNEALHGDEEGRDLERSIHESIGGVAEEEEVETGSMISSMVESLLARLKISVTNFKVTLTHHSVVELRFKELFIESDIKKTTTVENLAATSEPASEQAPSSETVSVSTAEAVRTAIVKGLEVWMQAPVEKRSGSRSRSSSSSSYASSDGSPSRLEMSQAIGDIRDSLSGRSMRGSFASQSSASMYESAIDDSDADDGVGDGEDGGVRARQPSEPCRSDGVAPEAEVQMEMIFNIGQEPLEIRLRTKKEKRISDPLADGQPGNVDPHPKSARTSIHLSVELGVISLMIHPAQACSLLKLVDELADGQSSHQEPEKRTTPPAAPKFKDMTALARVKAFHAIVAYEEPSHLAREDRIKYHQSIPSFWARPARIHPHIGHLRLRLDTIKASYKSQRSSSSMRADDATPGIELDITDIALYECLPPSLLLASDVVQAAQISPLLLFDHNLPSHGSDSVPASTGTRSTPQKAGAQAKAGLAFHSAKIDVIDWRIASQPPLHQTTAKSQDSEARRHSPSPASGPYIKTTYGERGWKVRPKHRRASSSTSESRDDLPVAAHVSLKMGGGRSKRVEGLPSKACVSLAPMHVFLDVSTVTRALPFLELLGSQVAALKGTGSNGEGEGDLAASTASTIAASVRDGFGTLRHISLLDELGGKEEAKPLEVNLRCGLVRLELRVDSSSSACSGDLSRKESVTKKQIGLDLRSGILVLEVKDAEADFGRTTPKEAHGPARVVQFERSMLASRSMRKADLEEDVGKVSAQEVCLYWKGVQASRAVAFAKISSLEDEDALMGPFNPPLLPRVAIFKRLLPDNTSANFADCRVPSLHLSLSKEVIDGLQLMADDLTQWSASLEDLTMDESDGIGGNDGLKILGSRFFGSRAGFSILSGSSDSTETVRRATSSPSFSLAVSEAKVKLSVPRKAMAKTKSGASAEAANSDPWDLELNASELHAFLDPKHAPNSSLVNVSVMKVGLDEKTGRGSNRKLADILSRTMDPGLTRTVLPMISLHFISVTEPGTSYRESRIEATLRNFTLAPREDLTMIDDLKSFAKSPDGAFEHVEPNEVTRLSLKIRDGSLLVATERDDATAALALGEFSLKAKLMSHAPRTAVKLALAEINLFLIEKVPDKAGNPFYSREDPRVPRSAAEHWDAKDFVRVVALRECKGSVTFNTLTRPDVDVRITKLKVKMIACADTLGVAGNLASAFSPKPGTGGDDGEDDVFEPEATRLNEEGNPSSASELSSSPERDLLSSVDENAFRSAPPMSSVADLIEDDLPSHPSYLGASPVVSPRIVESVLGEEEFFGGESVASLSVESPMDRNILSSNENVTIRLLDPRGIRPMPNYFSDPDLRPTSDNLFPSSASSVRVRVQDMDFSLRLHAGYDWASTRTAVEEEAKRVRRRLQKIKQLLAEGQTPDDSVEAATSNLLDSVHMVLPTDAAEMDPTEMLKAMDDELGGDQSEVGSSSDTGTWQPLPTLGRSGGSTGLSGQKRTKKSKLQRSRKSMIDINLKGMEVEFDSCDPEQESLLVSRVAVTAKSFEIIDNVKTSTWRTFLTEMVPEGPSVKKDAAARMLRVEIRNVRSGEQEGDELKKREEEVRVRAKISPLRLHVDQDALDFVKKFFAFKPPGAAQIPRAPETGSGPAPLPFIQYAEVYPIRLKLDYKPKRVNYNLLREGKTIELMNFFHFDGAEMTLRHVTLRGISGWPRLFDTLNDIWTPDVKANQIADILSGVAPIRSLVNVGAGVADLVLLPIEQWQRDGNVLRGVRKGAGSFAKSTALEAVRLGARLATGTQVILEQAEHILGGRMDQTLRAEAISSPIPRSPNNTAPTPTTPPILRLSKTSRGRSSGGRGWHEGEGGWHDEEDEEDGDVYEPGDLISKYADQPRDMREALSQAYKGLSRGLTSAAQTILAVPMEVYEGSSSSSLSSNDAVGGMGDGGSKTAGEKGDEGGGAGGTAVDVAKPVIKAVPIAVIRGAKGATEAFAKTLMGVQAQLGDVVDGEEGKYKKRRAAAPRGRSMG
ncbi:hypothetical protein IE53DRAFT_370745 [Violaceomyces palustris]|uniref:Uncharacterized protein n=1 Tax=Violaceomyces palustris TaxID=1673888 RepID=A0ACD0NRB5_9BASI|nr:hypothetical protein IE53DRAFT_370745 [Violaceomyces palustris]